MMELREMIVNQHFFLKSLINLIKKIGSHEEIILESKYENNQLSLIKIIKLRKKVNR